jgi:hypothetical protein
LFILLLVFPSFFVTDYEDYVCWEIEGVEGCCVDTVFRSASAEADGGMPAAELILPSSSFANLTNYYDWVSTFLNSSGTAT